MRRMQVVPKERTTMERKGRKWSIQPVGEMMMIQLDQSSIDVGDVVKEKMKTESATYEAQEWRMENKERIQFDA